MVKTILIAIAIFAVIVCYAAAVVTKDDDFIEGAWDDDL